MSAHKLKAYQVSEMRRHYQAGERVCVLAEWFEVSHPVVRYHTRDIRRENSRHTFDRARMMDLLAKGMPQEQVGRRLGVSRTAITSALYRLRGAVA